MNEYTIWAHTIDTLQQQSLSLMSSALDHESTSAILAPLIHGSTYRLALCPAS
jgi:hypothetical protein